MAITRQSIIRGPAIIRMGSQTFYSKSDVRLEITPETFPIESSVAGKLSERVADVMAKITFTPVGAWTTGQVGVLFPHGTPNIGGSLFGSSDTSVRIWPIDTNEVFTFLSGAITKMPTITLSPTVTLMGDVEITCVIGNGLERSAAGSLYTYAATTAFSASPNDERNFALSEVLTNPYTATFSSGTGWTTQIETQEGFEVSFDLGLTPVKAANIGTVDMIISKLDISVKFLPLKFTAKNLMDKLASDGRALGNDIGLDSSNLTITGGSSSTPKVVINNLRLKNAPMLYSLENLRSDTLEFIATRPTASGAMFTVGMGP